MKRKVLYLFNNEQMKQAAFRIAKRLYLTVALRSKTYNCFVCHRWTIINLDCQWRKSYILWNIWYNIFYAWQVQLFECAKYYRCMTYDNGIQK